MSVDCEPYASLSSAWYPSVRNRDNPSSVLSNVLEDGLRKVEVFQRRVAPAAGIVWESIVRWAEIGGRDHDRAGQAPFPVVDTLDLVARTTA